MYDMLAGPAEADFFCVLYGFRGHVRDEWSGHVGVERNPT